MVEHLSPERMAYVGLITMRVLGLSNGSGGPLAVARKISSLIQTVSVGLTI